MQLQEKKRQKEEREIVQRLKPLAKLQTGQDFEDFVEGIICMWSSFSYILYIPNICIRGIDTAEKNTRATTLSAHGLDYSARYRAI